MISRFLETIGLKEQRKDDWKKANPIMFGDIGMLDLGLTYEGRRDNRMNNTCICCGGLVPEGKQVCPNCEQAPKVNERFIIGIDINGPEDEACIVVCKRSGRGTVFVNKITGTKARDLYEILKGDENEKSFT